MSRLLVFASAFSRLHADLLIVRLKRAGIAPALISVIHPLSSRPNSALCWLGGSLKIRVASGEKIAVSGFLQPLLERADQTPPATLDEKFADLGLSHEQRVSLEETLLENRVVVAIDVEEKVELPTMLQTLQRAGAEKVFTANLRDAAGKSSTAIPRVPRLSLVAA